MKNVLFLINPLANENLAVNVWKNYQKKHKDLPKNPVNVLDVKNIKKLIEEKSPDIVAVAGGDGTINEIASAILTLKNKPAVAILPFGFGNALSYCLGVETIEKSLFVLKNAKNTLAVDVMKTNIDSSSVGLFNISMGFDARIVYDRMHDRYIGLRSYIVSAAKNFIFHPKKRLIITVNDQFFLDATASSLVVANAPTIGKNYLIAPNARLNDGLLDCTLFSTKYAYLTNMRLKGFKHPFYSEEGKIHFKAKKIRIDGDPFVQIDGNPFKSQDGIEIIIKKKAINFLRNEKSLIDQNHDSFIL